MWGVPAVRLAIVLVAITFATTACWRRSTLPHALSDAEFTHLIRHALRAARCFRIVGQRRLERAALCRPIQWMRATGGAYIGVGPEQNFSYIAALQPRIGFILDIRRENLDLQLLYKAALRIVCRSRRLRVTAVLASSSGRSGLERERRRIFERYAAATPSAELTRPPPRSSAATADHSRPEVV